MAETVPPNPEVFARPTVMPLPPGPEAISLREALRRAFTSIHDDAKEGRLLTDHPAIPFDPEPFRRLARDARKANFEMPEVLIATGDEEPHLVALKLLVAVAGVRCTEGWCEEEWSDLATAAGHWSREPIWLANG